MLDLEMEAKIVLEGLLVRPVRLAVFGMLDSPVYINLKLEATLQK